MVMTYVVSAFVLGAVLMAMGYEHYTELIRKIRKGKR